MLPLDPLGLSPTFSQAGEIAKKKEKKASNAKTKVKSFSSVLKTTQDNQEVFINDTDTIAALEGKSFDETLQYLVDSVYLAGDKLKKNPFTEELKDYRKSLSQFLNFIIKNSYEVETFQRKRGKKRVVYTLVNVVNQKLDTLATDILFNQADQISILVRIEEINGLLVDFFS